jgi:hypothetical protein
MAMPDLHPSGVVVPVVLAVSEHHGISGTNLLAGIALGLELCLWIGWAGFDGVARTSRFLQRGQACLASSFGQIVRLPSYNVSHSTISRVRYDGGKGWNPVLQ